jgi:ComF family protein
MRLTIISPVARAVVEAVYPPVCCVCGELFDAFAIQAGAGPSGNEQPDGRLFAGLMARHMCPDCAAAFTPVSSPLCSTCGEVFASPATTDHVCGNCRRVPKYFQTARAVGIYEKSLMTALQRLKYSGRTELAAPLGRLLRTAFVRWFDGHTVDLIAPVPLFRRKQRQRGFNQAFLLIRNGRPSAANDRDCFSRDRICKSLLVRTRMTRSQTALTKPERLANVRGAFAISDSVDVAGKSVLLIDDVYTTGATVNECARILMAGGAARVDVLTVARVK